ncbi:MAG: bifunctional adenosylcobinamide kinase/adenosylcobinamide-phosphate guanylyltransferase [Actinomycetota bacterium]|jgi:adenosyl cobinamide kinase/adenosyl cobinamide phosphate guanylyltransferase|nr:bifunctional adenosylcobinamide kinase/adenosylcobinamide-phosphate guanylyltransferase [Actinomycetota bacterium]
MGPHRDARVTLVLGGTRSGKSAVAERLAAELASERGGAVTYVATASVADEEMARRVAAHRARRPTTWSTVELASSTELPAVLTHLDGSVLVDSLGTWVASAPDLGVDARALVHALQARSGSTVLVSEEVGLAVHPATAVGRAFVDAVGHLNQTVAAVAGRVLLVVAGRTVEL